MRNFINNDYMGGIRHTIIIPVNIVVAGVANEVLIQIFLTGVCRKRAVIAGITQSRENKIQ